MVSTAASCAGRQDRFDHMLDDPSFRWSTKGASDATLLMMVSPFAEAAARLSADNENRIDSLTNFLAIVALVLLYRAVA